MEDQVGASQEYVTPGQLPMEGNYYVDPQGQRFNNPAEFDQGMAAPPPKPDFAAMRQEAMQRAVQQVTGRPMTEKPPVPPQPQPMPQSEPQVVYVRRNLTLAELVVVFAISFASVVAIQAAWSFATDVLPRIEIRDK